MNTVVQVKDKKFALYIHEDKIKARVKEVATQIDIYVLKYGFKLFNFSLATAAGIFKNVVNILLLLAANYVAKKAGEERLI